MKDFIRRILDLVRGPSARPLRDVRRGERVRVHGVVEAISTLESPLRQAASVGWMVKWTWKTRWGEAVRHDASHELVEFFLVDGDERALVRVAAAELHVSTSVVHWERRAPIPLRIRRHLEARALAAGGTLEEGVVAPGDHVVVVGDVFERGNHAPSGDSYREAGRAGTREVEIVAAHVAKK